LIMLLCIFPMRANNNRVVLKDDTSNVNKYGRYLFSKFHSNIGIYLIAKSNCRYCSIYKICTM